MRSLPPSLPPFEIKADEKQVILADLHPRFALFAEAEPRSPELFLLLRSVLDWDADQYAEWLSRTLADLLLIPEA